MLCKKIFLGLLLALSLFTLPAAGQISRIEQDFVHWTQIAVDGNVPEGSNRYRDLEGTEEADFRAVVQAFLAENWFGADALADGLGYEVVTFRDTGNSGETFYGLIPKTETGDARGFFFLRPRAQVLRRLVVQAAHAVEDERTGVLGSEIFRASGARALLLSGADRCASDEESGCTGETDCGNHRVSDMAHSVDTFFHAFHELASVEHADTRVLQIHGFKADGTEPEFSVSDGTENDNSSTTYLPNAFYQNLQTRMQNANPLLTRNGNSCNQIGHQDFQCGTQNVQGRHLNLLTVVPLPNACFTGATTASGRFVHLEMSNDLRDPVDTANGDPYSQQLVIDTVNAVFPRMATVGDRVWADLNANGLQDSGEPGVHGAFIEVLNTSNVVVESTTSIAGSYRIGNLPAGTYRVRVYLPGGYAYGSGLDSSGRTAQFSLTAGANRTTSDLPLLAPAVGQIGNFVWADNGDGVQGGTEAGIGSVAVQLLTPEGDLVQTKTTNSLGIFTFTNVLPGNYKVGVNPGTRGFTQRAPGVPASSDSEIHPATGRTSTFSLASGVSDLNRDAGLLSPCFDIPLIAKNSLWLWKTGETSWPSDWNQSAPASLDGWVEDYAPFGFGSGGGIQFVTPIPNPTDTSGIFTTYFRRSFEVDLSLIRQPLQLTFTRDDGVVIYLNGVEIARRNLPWGATTGPDMPASTEATATETISIPPSMFVSGTNVLAIELHEVTPEPNDTPRGVFELTLTGKACGCNLAELNLRDSATTYLEEDSKGSNNGTDPTAGVAGLLTDEEVALLRWQTTGLPADAEVLHAEIALNMDSVSNSSGVRFRVWPLLRSWVETQTTWNNAATGSAWLLPGGAKNTADRDFTAPLGLLALRSEGLGTIPLNSGAFGLIEGWVDNPSSNFGLAIGDSGPLGEINFLSDEDPTLTNRPTLRVIYRKTTCN